VEVSEVQVRRYHSDSFLINFSNSSMADRVLHASQPQGAELVLIFQRWRRQSGALFAPLRYKVLLIVENITAHIWPVQMVQEIIGSSCLVFEPALTSAEGSDLSQFMVVAWVVDPDLIPREVGCVIPEPEGSSVVGESPLFLRVPEMIHS
jgi:hypothetical protein